MLMKNRRSLRSTNYMRSKIPAAPMPVPTHMVTMPYLRFFRRKRMHDGRRAYRASRTEWMTQRDGTADGIDLGRVQTEILYHRQRLCGEGFIQFDPVHLILRQAGGAQGRGNRLLRSDAHDLRWHTAHGERDEARQWRQVELPEDFFADDESVRRHRPMSASCCRQ
jgi:hypothetical protein